MKQSGQLKEFSGLYTFNVESCVENTVLYCMYWYCDAAGRHDPNPADEEKQRREERSSNSSSSSITSSSGSVSSEGRRGALHYPPGLVFFSLIASVFLSSLSPSLKTHPTPSHLVYIFFFFNTQISNSN